MALALSIKAFVIGLQLVTFNVDTKYIDIQGV